MDGIRKREKLQAEGNSFRFVVCWLFVRVFCSSIRLEQTEHRAVNLLKEVESVNASERARREVWGRRKLALSAAGSLAKQLGSTAKMGTNKLVPHPPTNHQVPTKHLLQTLERKGTVMMSHCVRCLMQVLECVGQHNNCW